LVKLKAYWIRAVATYKWLKITQIGYSYELHSVEKENNNLIKSLIKSANINNAIKKILWENLESWESISRASVT